jgi:hypothetical protein
MYQKDIQYQGWKRIHTLYNNLTTGLQAFLEIPKKATRGFLMFDTLVFHSVRVGDIGLLLAVGLSIKLSLKRGLLEGHPAY